MKIRILFDIDNPNGATDAQRILGNTTDYNFEYDPNLDAIVIEDFDEEDLSFAKHLGDSVEEWNPMFEEWDELDLD